MKHQESVVRQEMAAPRHQYKPKGKNPREIEALDRSNKRSLRKICKCPENGWLPNSFPTFGPFYYAKDSCESAKEEAWKQVLEKSPEKEETIDIYLSAIRTVEKRARATYADGALDGLTESQFRWMMMKDGCFLLQLVLWILGASKELGYPYDHIIFGENREKRVVQGWIEWMFYVGNQIPLVVLDELMKQTFFQNVIKGYKKWDRPTDLLSKEVLYNFLILPAKEYANRETPSTPLEVPARSTYLSEERSSDLLHGLQNLVLGPRDSRNDSNEEDEEDEEGGDLEAGGTLNTEVGVGNGKKELCVSGFRRKGIHFRKSTGIGIRGIQFKNYKFWAFLYLPAIPVNPDTELLFKNLKYYEISQKQNEVTSYLGFMNQLISTYEDVNHLASKGILEADKPYYKERFLRMLKSLSKKDTGTTHNHRHVYQQLRDYSSFPWEYFKYVAIIAFLLSVADTIFGVLSYVVGVKQLHQSHA